VTPGRTRLWLALLAAGGLAYALLAYWLTTAQGIAALGALAPYVHWLYFLEHAVVFLALGALFGASLRRGREALVTRLARLLGDPLDAAGLAYTRRVTLAWALFCAALVAISALLFFLAPLEAWSIFANLLTLPLVGGMFAAEYALRLRRHPELCQGGVLRSVRAFWQHGASPSSGPR
jgi:uncharacterized membrane protein